ncbi:MAG: DUF5106 domain-containing protein [Paramuribaculum sp.]|nr:DUF5106 domain-containing protein [Paramuribaculum sp.]
MKQILTFLAAILLAACASNGTARGADLPAAGSSDSLDEALADSHELPLPRIPDSIREPQARATFLLNHFWDEATLTDTAVTRNEHFMERNFVNFVNLYPHANADSLPGITYRLLAQVTPDVRSRVILYDLIDKYLSDPESPVKSDDSYIIFLQQWLKLPNLNKYEKEEPRYRLTSAMKNRPGTTATDFNYLTREGSQGSLSSTEASNLLLLFYDPDCDHCNETIAALRNEPTVNNAIEAGNLKVLAVYAEGDERLWHSTNGTMPENWTVALDRSDIADKGLYIITEMPGIYLLDKDKKVIMRDPGLKKLAEALSDL